MASYFKTILHPELYHGYTARPPFFEGWYFKLVNLAQDQRYAIIPGAFLGENGHAFIQVLDGISGQTAYYTYPLEAFQASPDIFDIQIEGNRFTRQKIVLDLPHGPLQMRGSLEFEKITPWPITWVSPGIMGWYAWIPRMECYHGVLSLDHTILGKLHMPIGAVDFTGGRGYIEKDWGQAFPEAWVWFQSNHFEQPETCITASVANIPWMGNAFRGFIIGFWHAGTLHRFATYTGAKIERLEIYDDHVKWVVRNQRLRLEMRASRAQAGLLLGPTRLEMGKRVAETLNAAIEVRLSTRQGETLFHGQGRHAGLEVHNTTALLPD